MSSLATAPRAPVTRVVISEYAFLMMDLSLLMMDLSLMSFVRAVQWRRGWALRGRSHTRPQQVITAATTTSRLPVAASAWLPVRK